MQENYTVTKGVRISIVDDDESIREAVKGLIVSLGLSAEVFSSAEAFLNSGCSRSCDCLILDVRMPGLNGLELQRRLAADQCPIPIVFMTALYVEEVRTKAMEAGAVEVLRKPFTEKELVNAIGKSLALHKTIGDVSEEARN